MAEPAGYSGKPLIAKLGVKPGQQLQVVDAPGHYTDLIEPLPDGVSLMLCAWEQAEAGAQVVHAFFADRAALAAHAAALVTLPALGGMVWVSWPKKSSPLFRDLTENDIRTLVLPTGWVDVKVAAVDADWSGLKFLKRRA
jgi:hypothetical protein